MSTAKSNNRYLSKSRFKLALECPAKLNYTGDKAYVNTNDTNEMLKGLAEGGHQIGKLAQWIYAKQAEATGVPWFEIEAIGSEQQVAQTQAYLQQHESLVLFEPTFIVEHFLVRVDVLVKHGNYVQLIEVKSKSFDSQKQEFPRTEKGKVNADFLPYLQDVAFQTMVVGRAHPDWQIESYLMLPNKAVTSRTADLHKHFKVTLTKIGNRDQVHVAMPDFNTTIDHAFLCPVNVDSEVNELMSGTLPTSVQGLSHASIQQAGGWATAYANRQQVTAPLHPTKCSKCEFYTEQPNANRRSGFHECWKRAGVPGFSDHVSRKDTVLGVYDGASIKKKAMEQGKFYLADLDEDDVCDTPKLKADGLKIEKSQRQYMQVFGAPTDGDSFFDHARFAEAQATWQYPYYFLDFEGATSALPIRPGYRPNQQVVFQYSIHVMHEDGTVQHHEQYLDTSNQADPHSALLRQLKQDLGDRGTIFRWHNYENTVLNALHKELKSAKHPAADRDELLAFIESITEHNTRTSGARNMVDQAKLAAECYFHADTRGSSSIKAVLPAILGDSEFLRDTYSQPIYGGASGSITSKNYNTGDGITWWQQDPQHPGKALDPYDILKNLAPTSNDADNDVLEDAEANSETIDVANGGAALMAFVRIQSGGYTAEQQAQLEAAMLRYCELDTLAMVMIMQAWQHYRKSSDFSV
ncbi:DUF2779 domain-containing protein [Pseudidiomarina mangrovi]|uniref:DUF2779 domain-containing protein n=1 Tax=Pseudidiomarina mangrovi TaxID=2487133 RepID=UPI000FCA9EEF|nr:DUF2779 domain-containing protein [Pseudidiomarina mangrovi]